MRKYKHFYKKMKKQKSPLVKRSFESFRGSPGLVTWTPAFLALFSDVVPDSAACSRRFHSVSLTVCVALFLDSLRFGSTQPLRSSSRWVQASVCSSPSPATTPFITTATSRKTSLHGAPVWKDWQISEEQTAASSGYSGHCTSFIPPPSPELHVHYSGPVQPNLETCSTFFFIGRLTTPPSVQPKSQTLCCQADLFHVFTDGASRCYQSRNLY